MNSAFTVKTLAERWHCHPVTIRRMCKIGKLEHFTVGGHQIRIPASEVERAEGGAAFSEDAMMEAIHAR